MGGFFMKRSLFHCGMAAVAAISCVAGTEALAQQPVNGRVVDTNGAALPGARVSVPELGISAITNRQGEFAFASLPPGEAQLVIEYLGFPTATRGVTVLGSGRTTVEITLSSAANGVETIIVTGSILDGAARALNQQRNAMNTTDIVSADAIGRFPDANVAEALQRVPGFGVQRNRGEGRTIQLRGAPAEFTSITVDGTSLTSPDESSRAIELDIFSSDIVNAIEVTKTLLPHQEADAIAGSVNLVTRSPFDRRGLRFNAQGGTSFNQIGDGNDYRASGSISNTFGGNDQFGALISGSYSQTNRGIDNIEHRWGFQTVNGQDIPVSDRLNFKDFQGERTRAAVTGALEYRPDDATRFALRGSYSRFTDNEFRNMMQYNFNGLQPGFTSTTATWDRVRQFRQFRYLDDRKRVWTLSGTGEHDFGGMQLDYTLAYNTTYGHRPRIAEIIFQTPNNLTVSQDFANPDEPVISPFVTGEARDLSLLSFSQVDDREERTNQSEWSGRVNLAMDSTLFGRTARHQFGLSFRTRDADYNRMTWRDGASNFDPGPIEALLTDRRSQNFSYVLGNQIDEAFLTNYFNSIQDAFRVDQFFRVATSVENDYWVEESIFGGYAMTSFAVGNTDIIVGARVEHTEFASRAFRFNPTTQEADPNENERSYTNIFPNLTIRHAFSDRLVGRLALTRGIARPSYPDVVARVRASDVTNQVVRGNPDLRPVLSNNFDIGLEYYFEPLGLIAVNAFYKDLENFEFSLASPGVFEGRDVIINESRNAPDGYIAGVELTWQQSFGFLPGLLSNTGIFANYTYTQAEMDVGTNLGTRSVFPLQGQSDHIYNLALFYETERFNVRVSYTGRTDYLLSVNEGEPRLDRFWRGRDQLDVTASFTATDNFELFVEAKNLTDQDDLRYEGVRSLVRERERFGYSIFTGLRVNF